MILCKECARFVHYRASLTDPDCAESEHCSLVFEKTIRNPASGISSKARRHADYMKLNAKNDCMHFKPLETIGPGFIFSCAILLTATPVIIYLLKIILEYAR